MVELETRYDQIVIEQLKDYKRLVARIKTLDAWSIGNGITISLLSKDDKLQELHRKLRRQPSYMYLTKHEQNIETIAHAYLTKYPFGLKSQRYEVKGIRTVDEEDRELLKVLVHKIEKVIEARTGTSEGFEGVLKRLSELQDLQDQKEMIDNTLEALEGYRPHLSQLLRLRYIEDNTVEAVMLQLSVSRPTFFRWQEKAIKEYAQLSGIA